MIRVDVISNWCRLQYATMELKKIGKSGQFTAASVETCGKTYFAMKADPSNSSLSRQIHFSLKTGGCNIGKNDEALPTRLHQPLISLVQRPAGRWA